MARKKLPYTDDELRQRQTKFFANFDSESDRGCVLVAVAIIDECLEILLRSQLLDNEPKIVSLLFTGQGPLNSFWSKIQLARAMNIIPSWIYEDLERIRALRNTFAHRYDSADFSDPEVISITEKLQGANHAVVAIEESKQNKKVKNVSPNINSDLKRKMTNRDTKLINKERIRFAMTASYIGGWLESELKVLQLNKQISDIGSQIVKTLNDKKPIKQ